MSMRNVTIRRRRPTRLFLVASLVAGIGAASAAVAGDYSMSWWSVDGGAGHSVGGGFDLRGTIGQPDAGFSSGGRFELTGGFVGIGDADRDGVVDSMDNCLHVANAAQRDTDFDGIGNACDADLSQDCVVNTIDLGLFRAVFFTSDENADFDGDGVVNVIDLGRMRLQFFANFFNDNPSGVANLCD